MDNRSREQRLVDMCFQFAIRAREVTPQTNEALAAWVADNLRACGFPTEPVGLSWGVLTTEGQR